MCEWEVEWLSLLCLKVDNHLCNFFGKLYGFQKRLIKDHKFIFQIANFS